MYPEITLIMTGNYNEVSQASFMSLIKKIPKKYSQDLHKVKFNCDRTLSLSDFNLIKHIYFCSFCTLLL